MDVIRVLNNNSVLVQAEHGQAILLGKGLGFGRHLGDQLSPDDAEQIFIPTAAQPMNTLAQMVTDIPLDMIGLATEIASLAGPNPPQSLVLGLADHITFAIQRAQENIEVEYPLRWEVPQLFPKETVLGHRALVLIGDATDVQLDSDEALMIAMHFANASMAGGDFAVTESYTQKLSQILDLVETRLGGKGSINCESTAIARFVTHLRYLFVRLASGNSTAVPYDRFSDTIEAQLPKAHAIAREVAELFDGSLSDAEIAYLTLHISRLDENRSQN